MWLPKVVRSEVENIARSITDIRSRFENALVDNDVLESTISTENMKVIVDEIISEFSTWTGNSDDIESEAVGDEIKSSVDGFLTQHAEIYDTENSDRAFEEEVMLSGFDKANVKAEGAAVAYDNAQETFTARYQHETIALAFSITEEAIEDNLYDKISTRYTKALARSMAQTKQVKAVNILDNAFTSATGVT